MSMDIGWSIVLPMVGGVFLGQFLDKKFATEPKFTLGLLFFGIFLGFLNLITIARDASKDK